MNWMDINNMEPITKNIKQKLQSKNITAVWLSSHYPTRRICKNVNDRIQ